MQPTSNGTGAGTPVQERPTLIADLPSGVRWIPPIVAAALGLWQLGEPSLWIDEGFTVEFVEQDYRSLVDELQWGYLTLEKAWTAFAGTSELALRLPSVVAAVVAVILMYGLALRMFDQQVAFLSSLLLALNPFVVQWSQQARGYTVLLALVIAATWLLIRARERQDFVAWAEYGLAFVVVIHWHPFSAVLLAVVHVLVASGDRRALATWAAAAFLSVPWLDTVRHGASGLPTDWIEDPSLEVIARTAIDLPGALGIGLMLAIAGAFVAHGHRRLLVAWAFAPFALALALSVYEPVFVDRYLIISCPAFAALAAIALLELHVRAQVVAATCAAIATAIGLVVWYSPDGSDNWAGQDWRRATKFVMRQGGAQISPAWADSVFVYYGGCRTRSGWVLDLTSDGSDDRSVPFGNALRAVRVPGPVARSEPPQRGC